jgi:hypothetical protein
MGRHTTALMANTSTGASCSVVSVGTNQVVRPPLLHTTWHMPPLDRPAQCTTGGGAVPHPVSSLSRYHLPCLPSPRVAWQCALSAPGPPGRCLTAICGLWLSNPCGGPPLASSSCTSAIALWRPRPTHRLDVVISHWAELRAGDNLGAGEASMPCWRRRCERLGSSGGLLHPAGLQLDSASTGAAMHVSMFHWAA